MAHQDFLILPAPLQALACMALCLGVRSKSLSIATAVLGTAAGAFFAFNRFEWGGSLLGLSGLIEAVRGRLIRLNGTVSHSERALDSTLDRYAEFLVFAGLLIHFRNTVSTQACVLAAFLGSIMMNHSIVLAEFAQIPARLEIMQRSGRRLCLFAGAILASLGIGVWPILTALGMIAFVGNLSALLRIRFIRKQIHQREDRAIERTLAQIRGPYPSKFKAG